MQFTPEYFDPFGKTKDIVISSTIFKGLVKKTNADKHLTKMYSSILAGKHAHMNQLDLNNTACFLISQGIRDYQKVLISVINTYTKEFNKTIQKLLDSKEYLNEKFIVMYNSFITNAVVLKKSTKIVSDHLKLENGKFFTDIYLNYIFYENVINKKYKFKKEEYYLYKIMLMFNNKTNVDELLSLYKLYNYYFMFTQSIEEQYRSQLFNSNLDYIFCDPDNSCSNEFGEAVLKNIDIEIRSILMHTDTEKRVAKIVSYIKMGIKMCNTTHFVANYLRLLQNRLLDKSVNYDVENLLIGCFSFKDEPELYNKMTMCVDDMMLSDCVTTALRDCDFGSIKFKSDKYKKTNPLKFNKNVCNYSLIRNYAWNDCKVGRIERINDINVPAELSFYIDILNSLLKNEDQFCAHFHDKELYLDFSDRELIVDYHNSKVVFEATFMTKKYQFVSTMMQAIIFATINNNNNITASQLAIELNVSLKRLSSAISSLAISKLIISNGTSGNDVNMKFIINEQFSSTEECIDISHILYKILEKKNSTVDAKNSTVDMANAEKLSKGRAKVLQFLQDGNEYTLKEIKSFATKDKLNLTDAELTEILHKLVESKSIIYDMSVYKCNDESDSDSDSDSVQNKSDDESEDDDAQNGSDDESEDGGVQDGSDDESEDGDVQNGSDDESEDGGVQDGSDDESEDGDVRDELYDENSPGEFDDKQYEHTNNLQNVSDEDDDKLSKSKLGEEQFDVTVENLGKFALRHKLLEYYAGDGTKPGKAGTEKDAYEYIKSLGLKTTLEDVSNILKHLALACIIVHNNDTGAYTYDDSESADEQSVQSDSDSSESDNEDTEKKILAKPDISDSDSSDSDSDDIQVQTVDKAKDTQYALSDSDDSSSDSDDSDDILKPDDDSNSDDSDDSDYNDKNITSDISGLQTLIDQVQSEIKSNFKSFEEKINSVKKIGVQLPKIEKKIVQKKKSDTDTNSDSESTDATDTITIGSKKSHAKNNIKNGKRF